MLRNHDPLGSGMKLRFLGCYGGDLGSCRSSAFLVDSEVLLDAGGAASTLELAEARRIRACVITHPHLDHVASLPFLLDVRLGCPALRVYALKETIELVRVHLFNDRIWPDFGRIPNQRDPMLLFETIAPERPFTVEGLTFTGIPVHHSVPTLGFVVSDGRSKFALSSDTGPTRHLWDVVHATPDVRAVLLEVSFPNRLERIATASMHLTPAMLREEILKLPAGIAIYLHHLKPAFLDELMRELEPIMAEFPNVRLAEQGATYEF